MLAGLKAILRRIAGKSLLRFYRGWVRGFMVTPQKSFSQKGEDLIISNFFGNQAMGYYMDIGCFHPKQISNTYLFHLAGWHGLAVDVDAYKADLFKKVRRGRCGSLGPFGVSDV